MWETGRPELHQAFSKLELPDVDVLQLQGLGDVAEGDHAHAREEPPALLQEASPDLESEKGGTRRVAARLWRHVIWPLAVQEGCRSVSKREHHFPQNQIPLAWWRWASPPPALCYLDELNDEPMALLSLPPPSLYPTSGDRRSKETRTRVSGPHRPAQVSTNAGVEGDSPSWSM